MAEKGLPKIGAKIPIGKFHVSKMNVRWEEPFGESEEDQQLTANLRRGRVVQPFKARPEGKGYGVVVGRRRFLAKKQLGTKSFVVGVDCLVENMSDEEAMESSIVENLEILRKPTDPITRAKRLNELIARYPGGLRAAGRKLGIKPQTLSEWLKPLELSPKMQEALSKNRIFFTDALHVARLDLGKELQDELAEVAEADGLQAFKKELVRAVGTGLKRGLPKGMYEVDRVTWDKRNRKEMGYYGILKKVAEIKGVKVPEYIKDFVIRHIDDIRKEIA